MKIGLIGCGNMATGIIRGILASGQADRADLAASARTEATKKRIREELGITCAGNEEIAASSDLLILAVKPQVISEVISQIRTCVKDTTVLVSIAPGKSLLWLKEQFQRELKIIRAMPNTPALVQEGMTAVCPNELVSEEELSRVLELFQSFGSALRVPEKLLDAVTVLHYRPRANPLAIPLDSSLLSSSPADPRAKTPFRSRPIY